MMDERKRMLLICGFGTGNAEEMEHTYGRLFEEAREANPLMPVRLALTSPKVIKSLYAKYAIRLPDVHSAVREALENTASGELEEIRILTVQVAGGTEFEKLKDVADTYGGQVRISLDSPLLAGPKLGRMADILVSEEVPCKEEAVVYVGHGTHGRDPRGSAAYRKLEETIRDRGNGNIFIGDLQTGIEPLAGALSKNAFQRIRLCSLMMVSGHHWLEDVAGNEKDSWKSVLTEQGYEVTCIKTGLLERKEVRDLLIEPA